LVSPLITATGPQPPQEGESLSGLAKLGFASGGIAAAGFIPTKNGRVWDKYLQGIRTAETAFPSAILRTFRTSEILSPLESWDKVEMPAKQMVLGGKYSEFLKTTFGSDVEELSLKRTGSVFGEVLDQKGKALGLGIQMEAGTQKGASISDYYARLTGTSLTAKQSLNESLLKSEYFATKPGLPFEEWIESMEPSAKSRRLILGAKFRKSISLFGKDINLSNKVQAKVAKLEVTGQVLRAKAASTAGRLNTLLSKPFELLPERIQRFPVIQSMAVKPSSALKMMGSFTKKAIIASAAYKGFEYYDYLRAKESPWTAALGVSGGALTGGMLFKGIGRRFSPVGFAAGAAFGLYASIAPRFDKGLFHGAASIFTDANLAQAKVSQSIGLTESLQRQEEVTPGLVSVKTALGFAGVGSLGAGLYSYGSFLGAAAKERLATKGGISADILQNLRESRPKKLAEKLWGGKLGNFVKKLPGGKQLTKIKSPMALGAIGGLAAYSVLSTGLSLLSGNLGAALPGASLLGTTETPEELQSIYSGEKEVAIRKGRWWEFGRSSGYEGGRIEYYRPHFLKRLESRAYQKGLYGSEEERWDYDPMLHPLKALFGDDNWKYHYEKKYQQERPAPLTSTYGEDIPFIGSLVAGTIGKLLKPRKLVRPDEWMLGNGEYVHLPESRRELEPAYELGGLGPGAPVSPEDSTQVFNDLMYRRREAVGLVGFAEGSIEKAATGREEVFQNLETLGTMSKETGSEYWLWSHLNIGGGLGTSEPIRRFIPHTRSYLDEYNPLKNTMPSWMPQDYFTDLTHGNPFKKIKEAEIRLPGEGYAALHPELEGLSAEEYPLAHRLKILGDVAMWSSEYKNTLSKAKKNVGLMSDKERSIVSVVEQQVKNKKTRREFNPYRFNEDLLQDEEVTVTEVLDPKRIKTAEYGDVPIELQGVGAVSNMAAAMEFAKDNLEGRKIQIKTSAMESRKFTRTKSGGRIKAVAMMGDTDYGNELANQQLAQSQALKDEFEQLRFSSTERLAGRLGEAALHGIDTPIEMLTPMSPASKMIRQRSALEEYKASEAIGTSNAFWDKPIENFLKPATDMTLASVGFDGLPQNVKERRDINEYFDMLEWVKSKKIEKEAILSNDLGTATKQQIIQQKTLFGLDVYGPPANVMRALPRSERDFFTSFSNAQSADERAEIAKFIPQNEQRIYTAQWLKQEESAARAKKEAGIADKVDDQTLVAANIMRNTEGFGATPELEQEWMAETNGQIPFDDWIRERKADEYFSTHSLPGADWLGWHPSVDMDDVKIKYVEMAGLDHHDFDLWGSRRKALARKPYINTELINQMSAQADLDNIFIAKANAKAIARSQEGSNVQISNIGANLPPSYNIEIVDKREDLINAAYKELGAR